MRHFLSTEDWSRDDLQALIDRARAFRDSPQGDALKGKSIALLFFNPSLRTRTSFDLGAHQLGGHAIVLDARGSVWPVEFEEGAVMDQGPEEHVKEAARVLSSYVDLIAIRAFPKFEDWQAEREDPLITAYAKHATVPVINMETIVHPCQELALMMALQDRIGDVRGKDFLLTWVPHPKPLNTAVANSAILIAPAITTAYLLGARVIEKHFTDDKTLPGNDHYHAMDVHDLRRFRAQVERIQILMGPEREKRPVAAEAAARRQARRSIVLTRDMQAGEVFTEAMLTYKRPGTGISPAQWREVVGRRANRDLVEDHVLQWENLIDQE